VHGNVQELPTNEHDHMDESAHVRHEIQTVQR